MSGKNATGLATACDLRGSTHGGELSHKSSAGISSAVPFAGELLVEALDESEPSARADGDAGHSVEQMHRMDEELRPLRELVPAHAEHVRLADPRDDQIMSLDGGAGMEQTDAPISAVEERQAVAHRLGSASTWQTLASAASSSSNTARQAAAWIDGSPTMPAATAYALRS